MTTSTEPRQVRVPANYDQIAWKWMRYSAFLLIPLAWGHIILQDVVVGVHNITTEYAIERVTTLGWKIYDILLLAFAFAHGMNGLRQVARDFIHNPVAFRVVSWVIFVLWLAITTLGAVALLLVKPG